MKKSSIKHYDHEWALIISAYLYEITPGEDLLLDDFEYDMYSRITGSTIPGFSPDSGLWIHELMVDDSYRSIVKTAISRLRKYRRWEGTAIIHLVDDIHILEYP